MRYAPLNKTIRTENVRLVAIKLKKSVYEGYGNKCNCCGEVEPMFLTIDHVNNDGFKDKTKGGIGYRILGITLYKKIIEENFPSKYQLLCWNCNCGKARNKGVCPHEIS